MGASSSKLAFSYNVTVNKTTGFSPYALMFGRSPRLPIDSVFEVEEKEKSRIAPTYEKYVDDWETAMNQAFTIAKEHATKSGCYNKNHKKVREADLEVGDRVLLRNREKGGTGKLRNYWEERMYAVTQKDEEIPVVTVKPEAGGKVKRVHRNNVLKSNFILPENQMMDKESSKEKKSDRSRAAPKKILRSTTPASSKPPSPSTSVIS